MSPSPRRPHVAAHRALVEGRAAPRPHPLRWAGGAAAGLLVVAVVTVGLTLPSGSASDPLVVPTIEAAAPGSTPIGSMAYPVPDDALFVAPDGDDAADGSSGSPLSTVQQAVTLASDGQTIVMREGNYRQRVTITEDKRVTLQPYPGEEVWFEGSRVVDNWEPSEGVWIAGSWDTVFDTSPTYSPGAPDNTEPGWNFLDPSRPLAAHPDQVWVDGVPQRQVATAAEVGPGSFAVDTEGQRLILGTDPAGAEVRASDRIKAISVQSEGTVIRGIGIRRYSPSVPNFGALTVERGSALVENVVIEDSATSGLFVTGENTVVRGVTVVRSGMLGVSANFADGLIIDGLVSRENNLEGFNNAPVSGGVKITRSRGLSIRNVDLSANAGPGLWFDQSVYDVSVLSSTVSDNDGHGIILEISSRFAIADSVIAGNTDQGIKVNDTDHVRIWNSSIIDNGRSLSIAQDDRRASDLSIPGHDERREQPDPDMPWIVADVTVANTVMSHASQDCVLCVEDYSGEFTAEQMGLSSDGNVYVRADGPQPAWLVVWSQGAGNPRTFTDLAAFSAATGQDRRSVELAPGARVPAASVALVLPYDLAGDLGVNPLLARLGARSADSLGFSALP